ncbi:SNF2 family DNA-dependent ATPase [Mycena indigotica]|uniref:SNF2 family DNA-dependent ATPase n=1 Tax=Mycena indigotica TaxID=2126181 RepID=A0A8H6SY22_9AGAR|nr:SNF2 family DNA-dependent ATPase [Mycena indigotica]KAF7306761.1 SNF2 family DNA-dependent ATPase [Mycena indigotica]
MPSRRDNAIWSLELNLDASLMLNLEPLHPTPNSVFHHPELGPVHIQYYPPISHNEPDTVCLFIPGNPGQLHYYESFFFHLQQRAPRVAIFAHAHISHTPGYHGKEHSLAAQVQSAIEAFDALQEDLSSAKIILMGHSVGAWIALQVLKARPQNVSQVQLLFPTITHIARTPNGRRLSWAFRSPIPRLVSWLSYLTRPLPISLLFRHWPKTQISVLRSLLNSPPAIYACLSMAHDEMHTIRELDEALLVEHRERIFLLFGALDDWVAENKQTVLKKTPTASAVHHVMDFVKAPTLSPTTKGTYLEPQSAPVLREAVPADEVIGEYTEDDTKWYYARYQGGIAHKYSSVKFEEDYPMLVAEYLRKKAAGELAEFSPSAHYVHPKSRVRLKVKLRTPSISSRGSAPPTSTHSTSEPDELTDSEDELEDESDGYDEDESVEPVRRSARNASSKAQSRLPFSPKKTRSRRPLVLDSDSDDDQSVAPRRSSRQKRTKISVDRSVSYDPSVDRDGSDYDSAPKTKRTKKSRKLDSRLSHGQVKGIEDLDCDYDADADSAGLRVHRSTCEKCDKLPTHLLLEAERKRSKNKKGRRRKSTEDEFEESGDELEKITKKGGWVRCSKCPVAVHWACLSVADRDEILKAVRDVDRAAWRSTQPESELQDENGNPKANKNEPSKRAGLDPEQFTEFICGACLKGGICMGCKETALEPELRSSGEASSSGDVEMKTALKYNWPTALFFRCLTCKRMAHYEHLPIPSEYDNDASIADIAAHYTSSWQCADCASFTFQLDKILAWRPYPETATEPRLRPDEVPHYKSPLPREYLVKWQDRSYRRTQWVPHMWLASTNPGKLKHFLAMGPKVELLEQPIRDGEQSTAENTQFQVVVDSRQSSTKPGSADKESASRDPLPDAEKRIPPAWKTVDRVLDIILWRPSKARKAKGKGKARIESEDEEDDLDEELEAERTAVFDGAEPSSAYSESLADWESRTKQRFSMQHIGEVAWAFIKWDDLTYDEASWDSPPLPDDPVHSAFATALQRFVVSRDVWIADGKTTRKPGRAKEGYSAHRLKRAEELNIGQDPKFKLMDFQVDGFNWLCDNWWNNQQCILADEMGLGKTVQIATFIGKIIQDFGASPALVVVPNSTITNWVREFERWAPNLRVVPFYGEAKSRAIIREFELVHKEKRKSGMLGIKYHVLVTTYDTIIGREFSVFKIPRWEVLVVDEGQRLKSDSSLLFRKLNELTTLHRVIMTGTPLNNNIRELFNLMNFLDPKEWNDLEGLARTHEELNEDLIKDLHTRLRPYFLRRIKSQVLKLPPKNEVIVPVSMAPLQKEIFRSILTHNADLLNGLTTKRSAAKGKLNNVLMHMRKNLQHPYLYDDSIEPRNLPPAETHEKLIDASTKLRFLKVLLPKLKARGHRVLLFSQFVIALDIIEDFLTGEGLRFLRLDGNTKGTERQKGMDEFNREGSDVFIYLLTTRAGGVGINLFTADTVIVFDPDFNPHQDLQAIARAYRYGQKNTCLVFKLMVKDSPEERIIQVGKKKLVLDHLIVQKMDDDEDGGDNVESILTYGAQALFAADSDARDIVYSDQDIDKLIEKTEHEAEPEKSTGEEGAFSFSFAKVWAADKDTLEEVVEEDMTADSWAQTLEKINTNREKNQAQEMDRYGRGKQRAGRKQNYTMDESPVKSRSRAPSNASVGDDDSAYASDGRHSSDSDDSSQDLHGDDGAEMLAEALNRAAEQPRKRNRSELIGPLSTIDNVAVTGEPPCSLCGLRHANQLGACLMTEKSEHLAEFREMLILHPDDEPLDKRLAAIAAIDEILYKRGHVHLVHGQPLEIVGDGTTGTANNVSSSKKAKIRVEEPVVLTQPNAAASSSKRPLSPGPASDGPNKKARQSPKSDTCLICKISPHAPQDCPTIAEGPKRVSSEIKRLEQLPGTTKTVDTLRRILAKQKKEEIANKEVIDLSQL